jgi:hypothetical protein
MTRISILHIPESCGRGEARRGVQDGLERAFSCACLLLYSSPLCQAARGDRKYHDAFKVAGGTAVIMMVGPGDFRVRPQLLTRAQS